MKLRHKTQVFVFTLLVAVTISAATSGLALLVFPRDLWLRETAFLIATTLTFTVPVAFYLAGKIRENNILSDNLRVMLDRDRLTHVASRDYFFQQMRASNCETGAVLMVDIDHFKSINDTYGHLFGDRVIHDVAAALQLIAREEDIVCRFGGEEFVIFLPGRDAAAALPIAEMMRLEVAGLVIRRQGGRVRVTVSIGCAIRSGADNIDDVIHRADLALYRAKRDGRNLCLLDTELMAPARPAQGAA